MRHTTALATALLAVAVVATGTATAQAPDCTGISVARPVSGVDYLNQLSGVRVASGFASPVLVTSAPGDRDHLYVVERAGTIQVLENLSVVGTFLNIDPLVSGSSSGSSTSEQGLLGMAFSPDYQTNGHFFVFFTDTSGNMRVLRYTALSPTVADATSGTPVLTVAQPAGNHNGGTIAFGPNDGYLYIGTGDGGGGCDTFAAGQDITNQDLGKMLRIDVSSLPYTVPLDNPFVGVGGDDEIWSYGLRNPFRFSFDRIHGTLIIGDVGQNAWEEVSCAVGTATGGENYGWKNYEGNACPSCGAASCALPSYVAPLLEYVSDPGDSVIGGNVYQGCRMPELRGTYFYGNYNWNNSANDTNSFLRSVRIDETNCTTTTAIVDRMVDLKAENPGTLYQRLAGFGEDAAGEIYFVDQFDGELYKILPNLRLMEVSGNNAVPLTMSATEWAWEDLQATSGQPIAEYRIFRADGDPTGPFNCVHQAFGGASWAGGDPETPALNEVFHYLVQGRNAGSDFTYAGFRSDGTPRPVNNITPCP